jgi:hypothetical protein
MPSGRKLSAVFADLMVGLVCFLGAYLMLIFGVLDSSEVVFFVRADSILALCDFLLYGCLYLAAAIGSFSRPQWSKETAGALHRVGLGIWLSFLLLAAVYKMGATKAVFTALCLPLLLLALGLVLVIFVRRPARLFSFLSASRQQR